MISNKELDKMIKKCKTSAELKELITLFANEIIGKITDKQTLKILKTKRELEEKENLNKRRTINAS